jgi:hypothetical protein
MTNYWYLPWEKFPLKIKSIMNNFSCQYKNGYKSRFSYFACKSVLFLPFHHKVVMPISTGSYATICVIKLIVNDSAGYLLISSPLLASRRVSSIPSNLDAKQL